PFVFKTVPEQAASDGLSPAAAKHLLRVHVDGTGDVPGLADVSLPLPGLVDHAAALGHVQRTPDSDGVLRRMPLVYAARSGFVPALAFAIALRDMDVDPASIRIERGRAIRLRARGQGEVVVPIDAQRRTWINYAGPWGRRFAHYPYSWLVDQLGRPGDDAALRAQF